LLTFGAVLSACTVTAGGDDSPFDASSTDDTDTDDTDTDDGGPTLPDASPPAPTSPTSDASTPAPVDGSVPPSDASTPDAASECGEAMCCDAGPCSSDDAATASDAGCVPYEPELLATADGGTACFPSCVAELQARCMPAGECGASDFQNTCWVDGVTRRNDFDPETLSITTSMFADGAPCYQVLITSDDEGATYYSWRDSCGVEIATGDASAADPTTLSVTCAGSAEPETIDLVADECLTFNEGAPAGIGCTDDPSCGAQ
jgi:hypothetical protein